MTRIALTGGIASGKSTVADMFADLGAVIVDSDVLAREVVEPGTPGLEAIVERFGKRVLTDDGQLDRAALGVIVFGDDEARRDLGAITHPLVAARREQLLAEVPADVVAISVIPLLVEGGLERGFDEVIVVDVPVEVQHARLIARNGYSDDEAWARIHSQATREERLAAATHVIDNSGSLAAVREQVEATMARLRSEASGEGST